MKSDYVDNWDGLPPLLQDDLKPIVNVFDQAAGLLFDRRLNLSFEAAVQELSIPGIAVLTEGLRNLRAFLASSVTVLDPAEGHLLYAGEFIITAHDLPIYTPCLYLSQLAQYMEDANVRVWKESTASEIVEILLVMARYVRPDIEVARVVIAALHDMILLHPAARSLLLAGRNDSPNAASIAASAELLLSKRDPR